GGVMVNPTLPGCDLASTALAGVGVIFYVMRALRAEVRQRDWFARRGIPEPNLAGVLDLVALGTVADVVPLDHNNRILVDAGLRRIRAGRARPGILALLEVAGRSRQQVVAADLGFAVGPRLNAAGRLDDMSVGIECLLSEDGQRARLFAAQVLPLNQDRRAIERDMRAQVQVMLEALDFARELPLAVTLYEPLWHQGVIGILASRVKDHLHRPAIVFADADDSGQHIKGSARSIAGIHIRDVLDAVATRHPGLISKFGGHAMAAGLSLARARYEDFCIAFQQEVARHAEAVDLQAVVESDGELATVDFTVDSAAALRYAGPWGQQFPEPLFDGRFRVVSQRIVGQHHLKLVLGLPGAGPDACIDAIAFNVDSERWPDETVTEVEAAYRLDVNDFRGRQSVQLVIEWLRAAG
ncbi:MAG: DHHA1 domain-containing protein, partial [Parahaliea sp.]